MKLVEFITALENTDLKCNKIPDYYDCFDVFYKHALYPSWSFFSVEHGVVWSITRQHI